MMLIKTSQALLLSLTPGSRKIWKRLSYRNSHKHTHTFPFSHCINNYVFLMSLWITLCLVEFRNIRENLFFLCLFMWGELDWLTVQPERLSTTRAVRVTLLLDSSSSARKLLCTWCHTAQCCWYSRIPGHGNLDWRWPKKQYKDKEKEKVRACWLDRVTSPNKVLMNPMVKKIKHYLK